MDTVNQLEGALCEKYNRDGEKAAAQGYYTSAEKLFLAAIESAEKLGTHSLWLLQSMERLVALYLKKKKFEQAESYVLRLLSVEEARLGADHPKILGRLEQLAFVFASQAKYSKACLLYERILKIKEERLGGDHPQLIKCLTDMISIYRTQRQYEKAEEIFPRILTIVENSLGQDHPCLAVLLDAYADTVEKTTRGGEASVMKFLAGRIRTKQKQNDSGGGIKKQNGDTKTKKDREKTIFPSSAVI